MPQITESLQQMEGKPEPFWSEEHLVTSLGALRVSCDVVEQRLREMMDRLDSRMHVGGSHVLRTAIQAEQEQVRGLLMLVDSARPAVPYLAG